MGPAWKISPPSKIKLILAFFIGGFVHFLLFEYPAIYESFDINSYFQQYEDPLEAVLRNSATHSSSILVSTIDIEASTLVYTETTTDPWYNQTWDFTRQDDTLHSCPATPPNLVGPIRIWQDAPSMESLRLLYPYLQSGGHGQPKNCTSNHRVAVVVPFRDREDHLRILLHNLHSLLTKQQLDYTILVVEQIANQTFNRAKLMNVGFVEGMKMYPWECFIFHDVDLLPEDDRNLYTCPVQPRHMSVAIDKFKYKLPYGSIFGGISALTVGQLIQINGFSNDYWGWGGEDDDLSSRVRLSGLKITRYPASIARYKMIKHLKEEHSNPVNRCRYKLMSKTASRWERDGLNSLNYKIVNKTFYPLYTHVLVDLLEDDSRSILRREVRC
ncbi:unnamed protein product [Auanema sp. JU1783]|nr:unnamed protein product [Auanema sp. JU1783]